MPAKMRKGDEVIVLAGKDNGKKGTIKYVAPKNAKAEDDRITMAIRKGRQTSNTKRGRLPKEMTIQTSHISTLGKM